MNRLYMRVVPVVLALVVLVFTAVTVVSVARAALPDNNRDSTAVSRLALLPPPENGMNVLTPRIIRPTEKASRRSQLAYRTLTRAAGQSAGEKQTPPRNVINVVEDICLVNSTADSGAGSLRDCLTNASPGDVINFDTAVFPPNNPAIISLVTPLPTITTDSLTIDGSEAGVIVNGSQLTSGSGFELTGVDSVTIRGLQILNFPWVGVDILSDTTNAVIGGDRNSGAGPLGQGNLISGNAWAGVWILGDQTTGNVVQGNYIGTDLAGSSAYGGQELGVIIAEGAHENVIGGSTTSAGNVISGHFDIFSGVGAGVFIQDPGSNNNLVKGNFIGTNASGTAAIFNYFGVVLMNGTAGNVIGGTTDAERNLISGNFGYGVWTGDDPSAPGINITANNQIMGNYIGTDINGTTEILLQSLGILIDQYSSNNTIGGELPGMGNLISGHSLGSGIQFQGPDNSGHQVLGNLIGTDPSGTTAVGNGQGIAVIFGTQNVVIGGTSAGARNVVSGNVGAGILIQDAGSTGNQVLGNFVGADISGTASLGNDNGIGILNGAAQNSIGGSSEGAGNLISGNKFIGLQFQGSGTTQNVAQGNTIGLDVSGTYPITNVVGVGINDAQNNQIGGDIEGSGNLISGNQFGLVIQSSGATGNQIMGNLIGTDAAGGTAVPNDYGVQIVLGAYDNTIGGDTAGAGNLISGNRIVGLALHGTDTSQNKVWGNRVGTNISGTAAIGNDVGIGILVGAHHNEIGGASSQKRNLISGNLDAGILIQDRETESDEVDHGTTGNLVAGNFIGTNLAGNAAIPNKWGVAIAFGTYGNVIGGVDPASRNVISGNTDAGVQIEGEGASDNRVEGNYIGVDVSGTTAVSNYDGVTLLQGASGNVIGGTTTAAGNVISGNTNAGIFMHGQGTNQNQILANFIGTNAAGTAVLGNTNGIDIRFGPQNNEIGSSNATEGNLVSGNNTAGIKLTGNSTKGNIIQGNDIGTDSSGTNALPNGGYGLLLTDDTEDNQVGPGNKIVNNGGNGIALDGDQTVGNTITQNSIYNNDDAEIEFLNPDTPLPLPAPPQIWYITTTQTISATICANCIVEVFGNSNSEPAGEEFIRQCVADATGVLNCYDATFANWPYLAVTVTEAEAGTTSKFYPVSVEVEEGDVCDHCVYIPIVIK